MAYQPVLDAYEKSNPGAVKMVVKDWPWNTDCNAGAGRTIPGHEGSCDASVAVRLARDRGKGEEMVDWLFANQSHLNDLGISGKGKEASKQIRDHARTLGITDFDRDYALKMGEIRRDIADGTALHVTGTPTFIINGVRTPGDQNLPPEYFDLALKIELKKAGVNPEGVNKR
jgi:protein-disulfide isomerase